MRPLVLALLAALVVLLGVAATQLSVDDELSFGPTVAELAHDVRADSSSTDVPAPVPDDLDGHCGALVLCLLFLLAGIFALGWDRRPSHWLRRVVRTLDATVAYQCTSWRRATRDHPSGLMTC
jgi:hypothetical protein